MIAVRERTATEGAMEATKILVVEDDPNDGLLMKRAFKKSAPLDSVAVVRDGAESLDFLFAEGEYQDRASSDLPLVVLLDLNLPKISGLDVLRRIREDRRTRTLPVVILTSSDEQEDRIRGYDLGANSYVRKPVDTQSFTEAVTELGLYWAELNLPERD